MFDIVITTPLLKGIMPKAPFSPSANPDDYLLLVPETDEEKAFWPQKFDIELARADLADLVRMVRRREFSPLGWFLLGLAAERLAMRRPFDRLITPDHLAARWREFGVVAYQHQLAAAQTVIKNMGGRAILADEVGLGKTIEAGLILKEYQLRGMVHRTLILTPASLCYQWQQELREKFNVMAGIARSSWDWERADCLIASIDLAKKPPHRDIVLGLNYDMLIVDEAHKLKNATTQSWQFVNSIRKKYFLLLTATPFQNDLKELFNLIQLLRPGQLGTLRQFQDEYVAGRRRAKNVGDLRELLAEVMIRNRRDDNGILFPTRRVLPVMVDLLPRERDLYELVSGFVRREYFRLRSKKESVLPLITLQREVVSSSLAVLLSLTKMLTAAGKSGVDLNGAETRVLWRAREVAASLDTSAKADALERLLGSLDGKAIVFTEYRGTMAYLVERLQRAGLAAFGFDGSLSSGQKEWIRHLFRQRGDVLVSTESGGEGLNFQFCHHVINYDLPWNPMRLEQRIGRVHRLGQTHEVEVYNLAARGTVEEKILLILYEKLRLFRTVIGGVERLAAGKDAACLETAILGALLTARDDSELEEEFRLVLSQAMAPERKKGKRAPKKGCDDENAWASLN